MLDSVLQTATEAISFTDILLCTGTSLALGIVIALVYMHKSEYNKSFVITLALLPAIVQSVIMVVNGNLGTGVAVMGAFSLVRFRSVPGSAKEIVSIFFSMAVGLAAGMGYLLYAALFTALISIVLLLLNATRFGDTSGVAQKKLRVTIPENMEYAGLFDDLFKQYTTKTSLEKTRTTNLGSLFELQYTIVLKDVSQEKAMIDQIRQRNGNLPIICGRISASKEEL